MTWWELLDLWLHLDKIWFWAPPDGFFQLSTGLHLFGVRKIYPFVVLSVGWPTSPKKCHDIMFLSRFVSQTSPIKRTTQHSVTHLICTNLMKFLFAQRCCLSESKQSTSSAAATMLNHHALVASEFECCPCNNVQYVFMTIHNISTVCWYINTSTFNISRTCIYIYMSKWI